MKIQTKYFAEMEFGEKEIIFFPEGMPGFEEARRYLLIRFDNEDDSLLCLQSVEDPDLAFILVNPFYIRPDYEPRLTDEDLAVLCSDPETPLAFYVLAVLREPFHETTVNLKCPLAVNPANRRGIQAIMEDGRYSMREPMLPPAPPQPGKED